MRLKILSLVSAFGILGCSGGGDSTSATPTPTPPTVGSVDVVLVPATTVVGGSATATATVRSTTGVTLVDRAVTWRSSSPSIAAIAGDGRISALWAGSATITATAEGLSGVATFTVTEVPVGSVTIAPADAQIQIAQTQTLTATLRDANGNVLTGRVVEWSSSNSSIASVSPSGAVTGVAVGTATVTATSEGRSGAAVVTITPVPVASVVVSPSTGQITVGGTQQFAATALDATGSALSDRAFSWTSSNASVATVSANGLVTALTPGQTTITASSEGRSGSASLTVIPVPVASVTVALGAETLLTGSTTTATATLRAADGAILTGRDITWSSSNQSVATVSASGLVTAASAGSTQITATSEGRSGSTALTVAPRVATVTLVGAARTKVGDTYSYSVQARDAGGNLLTQEAVFRLGDPSAGSMTPAGVLVPQRTGSITIIVTVGGSDWSSTISAYDWQVATTFVSLASDERVTNQFGTSNYVDLVVSCATGTFLFVWVSLPHFVTASGAVAYSFDGGSPIGQTWDEVSNFNALFFPGSNTQSRNLASTIAASRLFAFAFGEFRSSARAALFRPTGLSALLPSLFSRCPGAVPPGSNASAAAMDLAKSILSSASGELALDRAASERAEAGPQADVDPSAGLKAGPKAPALMPMVRAR
jgi:uncharacterized protein YjdB